MEHLVRIFLFFGAAGLVFFIFYIRIAANQESKRIQVYFAKIAEKFQLQTDFSLKSGNDWLPKIQGYYQQRHLLIERTIRDKYKYLVLSMALKNTARFHFHITPKNHVRSKEKPDDNQIFSTAISHIDKTYFVSSNQPQISIKIIESYFTDMETKYKSIWNLFSTLVVYENRITLVLLSVPTKLKYDVIIEQMLQDIHALAQYIDDITYESTTTTA